MRQFVAVLLLAFSGTAAGAPIVIEGARLFDGKSGEVRQPGRIVVENGRIVSVGDASAAIPAGAEVIRLGDVTLLPGFMDAHTHLSFELGDDMRAAMLGELQKTIAERTLTAAVHANRTLRSGFTTVRDLGASDFIDIGIRQAAAAGHAEGPRVLAAVRGIGTTGGHCDGTNGFPPGVLHDDTANIGNGPEGIRAAVRWAVKQGADVIKVCATGGVLSLNADVDSPQLTQDEMNALVDQAHSMGRRAAAHAHGAEGAKRAIRAGIDSIEHGSFLDDDALRMMIERGTYFVPTLMAVEGVRPMLRNPERMDPRVVLKARRAIDSVDATVSKAIRMGVKIALGTDAGVYRHGQNAGEFRLLVEHGMKPVDALKAGTSVTAELFGVSDGLGSLEVGKIADIVAVAGDPTVQIRDVEKVVFVMKDGKVVRHDRSN